MNKTLLLSAIFAAAMFASCSKSDDGPKAPGDTKQIYVDDSNSAASSWHYISLAAGVELGKELKSEDGTAKWDERKDWDIAINRYNVRTNSGVCTSVGALGGTYAFDMDVKLADVSAVPAAAVFVVDEEVDEEVMTGMGPNGPITAIIQVKRSPVAAVVKYVPPGSGGSTMQYLEMPVYIFRSADGSKYYKVKFTDYLNDEGKSGHIKFSYAQIYQ